MKKRSILFLVILAAACGRARTPQPMPGAGVLPLQLELPAAVSARVDPVIDEVWKRYDRDAAIGHVEYVSQYWRLPGNDGYDGTVDRVVKRLEASGLAPTVESYQGSGRGWQFSESTLAIVRPGRPDEVVLSKETHHIALCINSFSTPDGGLVAPLVDVGRGATDADYAGKDLKGAVLLSDGDIGNVWRRGIAGGAAGVISASMGGYLRPNFPGTPEPPRETWDILQWGSVPYDEAHKAFGFKSSPRAAATMRAALRSSDRSSVREDNRVMVRVTVKSSFTNRPERMVIAEIPGRVAPSERIVMAAHIQEPGANDNASGVATLTELVRALALGIREGRIPPPARTLTFLWLDEIAGSRQWIRAHPDDAKNVRYMFSMDMTGEDVRKTGGSFLIERWPDPGAVWDRPWDPHSEWGRGNVRAESLKGDLINDLHLAICERVAAKSDWVVRTNPYEGGSDHTVFGEAGVPSLLNWHFTDRYYHSSFDTADKSSPDEMRNVGTAMAASAWLLASADEAVALGVGELVAKAGTERLSIEGVDGQKLAAQSPDPAAARAKEPQIIDAWRKWYDEAVRSVARLIVGPASPGFAGKVDALAAPFAPTGPHIN